jgi:chorismate mutase
LAQTAARLQRLVPVPGSLPRIIRVLAHWNTERLQSEIVPVYLREAARLRPDLTAAP